MEIFLLNDEAYTRQRFHELELGGKIIQKTCFTAEARIKNHEQEKILATRQAEENDYQLQIDQLDEVEASKDRINAEEILDKEIFQNITARAQQLDELWPLNNLEKKLIVLEATLEELYNCNNIGNSLMAQEESNTFKADSPTRTRKNLLADSTIDQPFQLEDLPLPTQIGLKIFFRLCLSIRNQAKTHRNYYPIVQITKKLPSILSALPPFPLSPGLFEQNANKVELTTTSLTNSATKNGGKIWSVFEETFEVILQVLHTPESDAGINSEEEQAFALVAFIALSLKSGRMCNLLHGIKLLLESNGSYLPMLDELYPLLQDLEYALPDRQLNFHTDKKRHGKLMSFGKGDHGKLGHGQCTHANCTDGNCTENKLSPTLINAIRDVEFVKVDSLSTHSVAITTTGEVMSWGNGDKYRLGHGTTTKEYTPRIIEFIKMKGRVTDVACGLGHTLALLSTGELFSWGNGANGRLGLGDTNDRSTPSKVNVPESANNSSNGNGSPSRSSTNNSSTIFKYIFCGASHSLAITSDGRAFGWGKNNQGQCGHGHTNDQLTVEEIRFFTDEVEERVVDAAGGWEHTLFCTSRGRIYSCGCGYKDSRRAGIPPVLGHGDCDRRLKPCLIQTLAEDEEMVKVSCGWDHSLAVSAQGVAYSWGSGSNGKLGHSDEENYDIPTPIRALQGKIVFDAKAGCEHSVFLTEQSEVFTCGQGDSGRLGHGDTQIKKVPTLIESLVTSGIKPIAIAVGDKYNLLLVEENEPTATDGCESPKNMGNWSPTRLDSVSLTGSVTKDASMSSPYRSFRSRALKKELMKRSDDDDNMDATNILNQVTLISADHICKRNQPEETYPVAIDDDAKLPLENDRTSLVLFLLSHIDRLAGGYLTELDERAASPDHQRFSSSRIGSSSNLFSSSNDNFLDSTILHPYAIDTSKKSFILLLELLKLLLHNDVSKCEKKNPSEKLSVSFFQRMVILLRTLRVLKSNLHQLLGCTRSSGVLNTKSFELLTDTELSLGFQQIHHLLNMMACSNEWVSSLEGNYDPLTPPNVSIQKIVSAISFEAAQSLKIGFEFFYPCPSDRRRLLCQLISPSSAQNTLNLMQKEAKILVHRLCDDDVMRELILHVFGLKIARSPFAVSPKKSAKKADTTFQHSSSLYHDCNILESIGKLPFSSSLNKQAEETDSKDLINFMSHLVHQCAQQASEQLESTMVESTHISESMSTYVDSQLYVLSVLQSHLLGACSNLFQSIEIHQAQNNCKNTKSDDDGACGSNSINGETTKFCECTIDFLLTYVDLLFDASHTLLKSLHKATCQKEEIVVWKLNGTFFSLLIPNVIESLFLLLSFSRSCQKVLAFQMKLIEKITPYLNPILKLLDEVTWKLLLQKDHDNESQHLSSSSQKANKYRLFSLTKNVEFQKYEKNWIFEMEDAIAKLCGKIACFLMTYQEEQKEEEVEEDHSHPHPHRSYHLHHLHRRRHHRHHKTFPDLFKQWQQMKLLVSNGLFEPMDKFSFPTLSNEILQIFRWENETVFEVENEFEIVSSQTRGDSSGSIGSFESVTKNEIAEKKQLKTNQEFLLKWIDPIQTLEETLLLEFSCWILSGIDKNKSNLSSTSTYLGTFRALSAVLLWHGKLGGVLQQLYQWWNSSDNKMKICSQNIHELSGDHVNIENLMGFLRTCGSSIDFYEKNISSRALDPQALVKNRINVSKQLLRFAPTTQQANQHIQPSFTYNLLRVLDSFSLDASQVQILVQKSVVKAELRRVGLCLLHDMLRKLTSSSAKTHILTEFVKVIIASDNIKLLSNQDCLGVPSTSILEIKQATENLYVRIAKLIASDDSGFEMKKKCLLVWSVPLLDEDDSSILETAGNLIAVSGIVNILSQFLTEKASLIGISHHCQRDGDAQVKKDLELRRGHFNMFKTDAINESSSNIRLSPKLKTIENLLLTPTRLEAMSYMAWEAFCCVSRQLHASRIISLSKDTPSSSKLLHPLLRSEGNGIVNLSGMNSPLKDARSSMSFPRKRLTLPKKAIIPTTEEAEGQIYDFIFSGLTSLEAQFKKRDAIVEDLKSLIDVRNITPYDQDTERSSKKVLLYGNPMHITSGYAQYLKYHPSTKTSVESQPGQAFTVSMWIHLEKFSRLISNRMHLCLLALGSNQNDSTIASTPDNNIGESNPAEDHKCCFMILGVYKSMYNEDKVSLVLAFNPNRESPNSQWRAILCDGDFPIGSWSHLAVTCGDRNDRTLSVFIDGKLSWTKSIDHEWFNNIHPLDQMNLIRLGGTISTQSLCDLNSEDWCLLSNPFESSNAVTRFAGTGNSISNSSSIKATSVIDDVLIFTKSLNLKEIELLSAGGPSLFHLKSELLLENFCTEFVDMLFNLCKGFNGLYKDEHEGASTRWVKLFFDILERGPIKSHIYIYELLCQVMPSTTPTYLDLEQVSNPEDKSKSNFIQDMMGKLSETFFSLKASPQNYRHPRTMRQLFWKLNEINKSVSLGGQNHKTHENVLSLLKLMRMGGTLAEELGLSSKLLVHSDLDLLRQYRSIKLAFLQRLLVKLAHTSFWKDEFAAFFEITENRWCDKVAQLSDKAYQISILAKNINGWNHSLQDFFSVAIMSSGAPENLINERKYLFIPAASRTNGFKFDSLFQTAMDTPSAKAYLSAFVTLPAKDSAFLRLHSREDMMLLKKRGEDVEAIDFQTATLCHMKCLMLRSLMIQLRENSQSIPIDDPILIHHLLELASTSVTEAIIKLFGSDTSVAFKLRSLRLFFQELMRPAVGLSQSSSLLVSHLLFQDLEIISMETWERVTSYMSGFIEEEEMKEAQLEVVSSSNALSFPKLALSRKFCPSHRLWWHSNTTMLEEVGGGEVEIQDLRVKALQHFPTIKLAEVSIAANTGVWFYEALILSEGLMQIGYVDNGFEADATQGHGVGDHSNSWAFDGFRQKKWNVSSFDYGEAWCTGDVVGVLLDSDRMELSYYLNGRFLGVAFSALPLTPTSALQPAISLNTDQMVQFNFGTRTSATKLQEDSARSVNMSGDEMMTFLHIPTLNSDQERSRIQPIAVAMGYEGNASVREGRSGRDRRDQGIDRDNEYISGEEDEEEDFMFKNAYMFGDIMESLGLSDPRTGGFNSNSSREIRSGGATERDGRSTSANSSQGTSLQYETAARRYEFVEGLINLGFPREWALRCATETNLPLNESSAVNWIMEKMEKEASGSMIAPPVSSPHRISNSPLQSLDSIEDFSCLLSLGRNGRLPIMPHLGGSGRLFAFRSHQVTRQDSEDDLSSRQSSVSDVASLSKEMMSIRADSSLSIGATSSPLGMISQEIDEQQEKNKLNTKKNPFLDPENQELELEIEGQEYFFRNGSGEGTFLAEMGGDVRKLLNRIFKRKTSNTSGGSTTLQQNGSNVSLPSRLDASNQDQSGMVEEKINSEIIPLALTMDTCLTITYARDCIRQLILQGAFASKMTTQMQSKLLQILLTNSEIDDTTQQVISSRLDEPPFIRYLKLAMGYHSKEVCPLRGVPPEAGNKHNSNKLNNLQEALQKFLEIECQLTEESQETTSKKSALPLFMLLVEEFQYQVSNAAHIVSNSLLDGAGALPFMIQSSAWTLWLGELLFGHLYSLLESAIASDKISFIRSTLLNASLFQSIVTIAAESRFPYTHWKHFGFEMMAYIIEFVTLFHQKKKEQDCLLEEDKLALKNYLDLAQAHYVLEFFAKRYRNEKTTRLFHSDLTQLVFRFMTKSISLSRINMPISHSNINKTSSDSKTSSLHLLIESFSHNHAVISWKTHSPDEDLGGSNVGSSSGSTGGVYALQVDAVPRLLTNENEDPKTITTRTTRTRVILPHKGTYTLRHLLPDTRYKLRLVSLITASKETVEKKDVIPLEAKATKDDDNDESFVEIFFQTPSEPLFEMDRNAMGKNLELCHHNLTVKNKVNKKWHTIRASVFFEEGVHSWGVRIDRCVSKNIFIGVCTSNATLENYIGSDAFGWGFLANKAIWHNKNKLHSYGEIFKQGDLIQVTLDCNAKTLAFSRNGEYLGIAATNLHVGSNAEQPKWYPAFSMYNKDDQLTLVPPTPSDVTSSRSTITSTATTSTGVSFGWNHTLIESGLASASIVLEEMQIVIGYQSQLVHEKKSLVNDMYVSTFESFFKWKNDLVLWRENAIGEVIELNSTFDTTEKQFGFASGDMILTSQGKCLVLGERNHELWYEIDDFSFSKNNATSYENVFLGSWNLHTCREMKKASNEFPVVKKHRQKTSFSLDFQQQKQPQEQEINEEMDDINDLLRSIHTKKASNPEQIQIDKAIEQKAFIQVQEKWRHQGNFSCLLKLDEKLIAFLDSLAISRGYKSPWMLSYQDLWAVFAIEEIPKSTTSLFNQLLHDSSQEKKNNISTCLYLTDNFCLKKEKLLMRIGLLRYINKCFYQVIRLILPDLENWKTWKMEKTPNILELARNILFQSQKEKIIQELLQKSATPTLFTPGSLTTTSSSTSTGIDTKNSEASSFFMDENNCTSTTTSTSTCCDDPKELPCILIRLEQNHQKKKKKTWPFWKKVSYISWINGNSTNPIINSNFTMHLYHSQSLFLQLTKQMSKLDEKELRREYLSPYEQGMIPRTFHLLLETMTAAEYVDDIPTSWDQQYLEHLMQQDQTTRYLYLFEQVMKEIQSPSLPLFIPCTTKISKRKLSTIRLQLQVNAQLLSPQVLTNLQVKDTQVLEWYYRLGQLFGIAWRSKLLLPLQYLSLDFWNELVLLSSSGSSSSSNNNNRLIDAIRKGLFTIIPSRCVALLKGNQLRGILSANDLMFVSIIKQNAKYDPTQGHLQHFWQVVENFSSIERKHFFSFITGGKWTTLSSSLTTVVSFSHQDNEQEEEEEKDEQLDFIRHFQLELSEPLVDAIEHPDACFPVLEITTEHHAKLYVPIYSNDVILRKKLVLAMMSTETGFGSPTGFSPLTVGTKNCRGNIGS